MAYNQHQPMTAARAARAAADRASKAAILAQEAAHSLQDRGAPQAAFVEALTAANQTSAAFLRSSNAADAADILEQHRQHFAAAQAANNAAQAAQAAVRHAAAAIRLSNTL